jgi:hypothetical protein
MSDTHPVSNRQQITERRSLGAAIWVDGWLIRTDRRLSCPACGRQLTPLALRALDRGLAITCLGCHSDIFVAEEMLS